MRHHHQGSLASMSDYPTQPRSTARNTYSAGMIGSVAPGEHGNQLVTQAEFGDTGEIDSEGTVTSLAGPVPVLCGREGKLETTMSCVCDEEVSKHLCSRLDSKKTTGDTNAFCLLGIWYEHDEANVTVCYQHTKLMASLHGLQTRTATAEVLRERLQELHKNKLQIGELKVQPQTYHWF